MKKIKKLSLSTSQAFDDESLLIYIYLLSNLILNDSVHFAKKNSASYNFYFIHLIMNKLTIEMEENVCDSMKKIAYSTAPLDSMFLNGSIIFHFHWIYIKKARLTELIICSWLFMCRYVCVCVWAIFFHLTFISLLFWWNMYHIKSIHCD